jgi:hypothetical protein
MKSHSLMLGLAAGVLSLSGAACQRARAQAVAPVDPSASSAATSAEPGTPTPSLQLPAGWRDLKFGMSEAEVQQVILRYQSRPGGRWEKSTRTTLPTVRLAIDAVDLTAVDATRFHQWSIADLDDGAGLVTAWHEDGKLVAVEVTGKVSADVFVRKATEAYGADARQLRLRFGEGVTGASETRDVSLWRNGETAALVWSSYSLRPTLLLWSVDAMERRARDYQATLDAPALAAKATATAGENGTKF